MFRTKIRCDMLADTEILVGNYLEITKIIPIFAAIQL